MNHNIFKDKNLQGRVNAILTIFSLMKFLEHTENILKTQTIVHLSELINFYSPEIVHSPSE